MNKNTSQNKNRILLFKSIGTLTAAAMLVAVSAVFGKMLSINIDNTIRFSFENSAIILSGIAFGPLVGGAVGIAADLLGCVLKGFAINPFITVGSMCVGLTAGIFGRYVFKNRINALTVFGTTYAAHIVGNMIVKTVAMSIYFPTAPLLVRVPIYIITAAVEGAVLTLLFKNKTFKKALEKVAYNELR